MRPGVGLGEMPAKHAARPVTVVAVADGPIPVQEQARDAATESAEDRPGGDSTTMPASKPASGAPATRPATSPAATLPG